MHAIAQFVNILGKMAGEKDGFPLCFQIKQQRTNILYSVFIQTVHRLVQDQESGIIQQSLCDAQALSHPQGILAVVRQKEYRIDDISDGELFIILDAIQDPGNLGTIVRTAEAAGAAAVIMNKGCADIYSPKVVRSTMGSIFRVPFIYTEDLICAVDKIKSYGAYVYAATLSGRNISEAKIKEKRAFIIGNEGNGISADILSLAAMEISIPMSGKVESLNAAVSAAILMYL